MSQHPSHPKIMLGQRSIADSPLLSHQETSYRFDSSIVLDTMVDGVVIIDQIGNIQLFNAACERLFGFRREEVTGQNVRILMPEPYRSAHDGFLSHYKKTSERRIIGIGREVTGLRKNGTTFPMELSVGEGQSDQGQFFIGIIRDITERKRIESFIQDRESELTAVIETAVDGIIIIDSLGNIRNYNHACERMFGYIKAEAQGNNIKMLMPSPYYDEHDQYLKSYRSTGVKKIIGTGREVVGRRKNGGTFPIELSVGEIARDNNPLYVGILRDITERKSIEEALKESIRSTEQANQAKSEFLARVSHELRTPLNAILGFSEMMSLKTLGPLPESYAGYVTDIYKAASHLHSIVADLLELSQIETHSFQVGEAIISARDIIDEALAFFREQAAAVQCKMTIDCADEIPKFKGDARMLRQVLINLISNSIRSIKTNGQIIVQCQYRDDTDIKITVIDNGCGISKESIKLLFEPFGQARAYVSHQRHGTGLGLPISKGLIEMHGGQLNISSTLGQGTSVVFSIPKFRIC